MLYGCYQNARDGAWKCLLEYKVSELPVQLMKITREAGVRLRKNSEVNILTGCESGVAILINSVWYIIYDDMTVRGRRRFTIAHELGHIFLGHPMIDGHHGRSFDILKPQVESEADVFAARLLTPACVLRALEIHSAEEIANLCDISMTAASVRADRMSVLYERGKFLSSPLEQKVYEQFSTFIEKNKKPLT